MKNFILLLALMYSAASFGAVNNLLVNGLNANNGINVPENQATDIGQNKVRIETGNTNLLKNPSFEAHAMSTGWSYRKVSGDIVCVAEDVPASWGGSFGKRSLGQKCEGIGAYEVHQKVKSGKYKGSAFMYVKELIPHAGTSYDIRLIIDGKEFPFVSKFDKSNTTDDVQRLEINDVTLGAVDTEIVFRVTKTTVGTSEVAIDKSFVGATGSIFSNIKTDSGWKDFTPIGTWANTTYKGKYKQDGEDLHIWYSWTVNGAITGELDLSIPAGFEIDFTKTVAQSSAQNISSHNGRVAKFGVTSLPSYGSYSQNIGNSIRAQAPSSTSNSQMLTLAPTVPFTWAPSDYGNLKVTVPIKGQRSMYDILTTGSDPRKFDNNLHFSASILSTGEVTKQVPPNWITSYNYTSAKGTVNYNPALNLTGHMNCQVTDFFEADSGGAFINKGHISTPTSLVFKNFNPGNGNLIAVANTHYSIACTKTGVDFERAFQRIIAAALDAKAIHWTDKSVPEKSIEYEDEFHLNEKKTNRIFNGKPIYKRCFTGSLPNNSTLATGVDYLVSQKGKAHLDGAAPSQPVPFFSTGYVYVNNQGNGDTKVVTNSSGYKEICIEYTKL